MFLTALASGGRLKWLSELAVTENIDPPDHAMCITRAGTPLPGAVMLLPRAITSLPRAVTSLPRAVTSLPRAVTPLPRAVTSLPRAGTSLPSLGTTMTRAGTSLPSLGKAMKCLDKWMDYQGTCALSLNPKTVSCGIFTYGHHILW
jgi:hypothetical protein